MVDQSAASEVGKVGRPEHTLKVEPTRFADGLDVECKRKRRHIPGLGPEPEVTLPEGRKQGPGGA